MHSRNAAQRVAVIQPPENIKEKQVGPIYTLPANGAGKWDRDSLALCQSQCCTKFELDGVLSFSFDCTLMNRIIGL